jgi:hypothetical protein
VLTHYLMMIQAATRGIKAQKVWLRCSSRVALWRHGLRFLQNRATFARHVSRAVSSSRGARRWLWGGLTGTMAGATRCSRMPALSYPWSLIAGGSACSGGPCAHTVAQTGGA